MDLQKLKYSKCPNCKKHGIPALKKMGRFQNLGIECKYCGKKYKVKPFLSPIIIAVIIVVAVVLVKLLERFLSINISFRVAFTPIALIILVYEYFFAPLEEVD